MIYMTICSYEHMFIRTYVVQSVELWTSCGSCGTIGEQRGQDQRGGKALQVSTRGRHSVDPWSTHRPPLGTPRYGEVFLKAAWRGVRPTPPLTRELVDSIHTLMPDQHSLISQKGLAENLASAPASPFRDAPRRGRTSSPP